jgi:hypothetical protein
MMKAGVYCGSRWYRPRDWKMYGLFHKVPNAHGFSIGPFLFYRIKR